MSNRAYKILKTNDNPSFNLWHDVDLLNFWRNDFGVQPKEFVDDAYFMSVEVRAIKEALAEPSLWEKDDYRPAQLKEDIEGLDDNDAVNYICY